MYRANLYLHPHTHHSKSSTVPGAYPTATIKGSGSTDFTRTIQLTTDKPTQTIGRSSRNEAKGLFAAPSNGFFESPVMSRAHAEVRMVLEPHRKIVIQDTKSMHGTYVNGLQLHLNETAELQQGTEVTFGAEVTRGDDVYPAKTFRCEVEWERMRSPSPRPDAVDSKSRSGYGLSSAELEYESNLEDEDFDAEMEEHSQDERLSASSGASSPLRSPSREKSCSASGLTSYLRREEIAESHERSTRESLKQLNKVFEAKSSKIKDLIDRDTHIIDLRNSEERPNKQEDNTRPRMPTIHSLVNKTQSEQSKSLKVVHLVDLVGSDNDDEVEIIEKPASFNAPVRATGEAPKESKTICIDLDENESEDEDPEYPIDDDDDNEDVDQDDEDDEDMDSDIEDSGSVSGNEDEDHHMEEEEEEEANTSVDNETKTTQVPENKEANPNVTKITEPATVPSSEPSSPPDVMSSKRINVWAGFPVRESASVLPPIGRLPPSPSDAPVRLGLNPQQQMQQLQQHQQPYQRNMANMASGPRWVPNNRSSNPNVDGILAGFMDSKKEFFDARAKNFARVSAELNLGTDHPPAHSVLYPRAQWTDPELHQCTPLRPVPDWYRDLKSENGNSLLSPSVPKANGPTQKGQTTTTEENLFSRPTKTVKFWDKKESIETVETKVQEVENDKENNEEEDTGAAGTKSAADTDICDEDGDYDDEGDYEVGDYYCELESEDEDAGISDELDDIFDDEPTNLNHKVPTLKTQGDGNHKTGYSKFSIDDMMNHESPKGKTRSLEPAVLASPPPSESSPDSSCDALEKSKAVPALEDILNPAAPSTPPPTLKRKRSGINAPISSPTPAAPPMIVDQGLSDAPEVVDTTPVADYPELAVDHAQAVEQTAEVPEDRPAKRTKSDKGGRSIVGLATAAMAGAVVGGIGMFAALVASAQ